jgi:hypothetical protein
MLPACSAALAAGTPEDGEGSLEHLVGLACGNATGMQRNRGGLSRRQRWSLPCVGIPRSSTAAPRPHPPRGHSTCAAAPHRLGSRDGTLAGRRVPPARGHAVCACRRRQPPSPHTGCRRSQRRSRCGGRTPRRAARLQAGRWAGRQAGGRAGRRAGEEGRGGGLACWKGWQGGSF